MAGITRGLLSYESKIVNSSSDTLYLVREWFHANNGCFKKNFRVFIKWHMGQILHNQRQKSSTLVYVLLCKCICSYNNFTNIHDYIIKKKYIYTIIIHIQICFLILYLLIYTQRDKEGKRERERERDDLGELRKSDKKKIIL